MKKFNFNVDYYFKKSGKKCRKHENKGMYRDTKEECEKDILELIERCKQSSVQVYPDNFEIVEVELPNRYELCGVLNTVDYEDSYDIYIGGESLQHLVFDLKNSMDGENVKMSLELESEPTKIYQVIKCTGSYEYYYERVIGTYFDYRKAMDKLEEEESYIESLNIEFEENGSVEGDDGYYISYDELESTIKIEEFEVI